jgi:hypothetical protein
MGKQKKKAYKRLALRQERWENMVAKMGHEARRAYKKPGSLNRHKT